MSDSTDNIPKLWQKTHIYVTSFFLVQKIFQRRLNINKSEGGNGDESLLTGRTDTERTAASGRGKGNVEKHSRKCKVIEGQTWFVVGFLFQ